MNECEMRPSDKQNNFSQNSHGYRKCGTDMVYPLTNLKCFTKKNDYHFITARFKQCERIRIFTVEILYLYESSGTIINLYALKNTLVDYK